MDQTEANYKQVQQNILKQQMNFQKIRIITIPKQLNSYYYYSQQDLLLEEDKEKNVNFYSINEDGIEYNRVLTHQINNKFDKKDQIIFVENHLIVKFEFNLFKINLDNLDEYQSFTLISSRNNYQYKQINRNSYISDLWIDHRLRIYSLKNFKRLNTMSSKFDINQMTYFNYMIQTKTVQDVYYFNREMTKQIRKYSGFKGYLHIFNSNHLFVPINRLINRMHQLTQIKIYYICNMKLRGTIEIQNRKFKFHNFIFIQDANILAVQYSNRFIDLYDFNSLQLKGSSKLNHDYQSEMKYDKQNGLTLFQWREISNKNYD